MNNDLHKGFSRYERNGVIALCILILLSIVLKKYVVQQFAKEHKLTKEEQQKIVQLTQQIQDAKTVYTTNKFSENKYYNASGANTNYAKKPSYAELKIEVNSASSEDFEKLYGIGKVLSKRIVEFRAKLGGFHSIEQIKHVWGIEDSVYQNFKKNLTIKPAKISKLNINTATYEELTVNPYFFSTVAKQIIGYRTKVKPFESVEDVQKLYYVKDHPEHYEKMLPYVAVD